MLKNLILEVRVLLYESYDATFEILSRISKNDAICVALSERRKNLKRMFQPRPTEKPLSLEAKSIVAK